MWWGSSLPPSHSWQASPIGLTSYVAAADDCVAIYSLTTEPTMNDTYVRLINDNFFDAPVRDTDNMGFYIIEDIRITELHTRYVMSYIRTTNV